MLFDTDILIWVFRGNNKACGIIQEEQEKYISVISYMELLQGAKDKAEIKNIRSFLKEAAFQILPVTENIGYRASVYMEEYCLKSGLCMADALLAATATENQLAFCTGNGKHYKSITEIDLKIFKP